MSYKEYLNSNHWKSFRSEILKTRKKCQICSVKVGLNIHHKHYKNFGKEKNEDVIVLCKKHHIEYHKKKKWVRVKLERGVMDFTKTSNPESLIYNTSKVFRLCVRCGEKHSIFYMKYSFGVRLLIACPNSKPRISYLPFEDGLSIPTYERTSKHTNLIIQR